MGLRDNILRMYGGGNSGRLPAGYVECEYLESTGTQYINTGVAVYSPLDIDIEFAKLETVQYKGIFGNHASQDDGTVRIIAQSNSGNGYFVYNNIISRNAGTVINGLNEGVKTSFQIKDGSVYNTSGVGNSLLSQGNTRKSSYPMCLFRGGINSSICKCRIYKFAMYDYYTRQRTLWNGIPALDPDGRPCMYDTVSKQPFYNAGTEEFSYQIK